MMPDFSERSSEFELMDDPAIDDAELTLALRELEVINRTLNGYGPSFHGIRELLPPGARRFSFLDVGTGGGDLLPRLHTWCVRRQLEPHVLGVDLSPTTIEYARRRCEGVPHVELLAKDLFEFSTSENFDIVHCALVLHHFQGDRAVSALAQMFALARWGVVINDLHRHPFAYYSIRTLTKCLSRSRMIQNDAPLSVMRAFRRNELLHLASRAGVPSPAIRWCWAFRWSVVIRK